jgi:hypothetical protein
MANPDIDKIMEGRGNIPPASKPVETPVEGPQRPSQVRQASLPQREPRPV